MNMKKIVAVASALSLTAAVTVGGTLAWLQKQTTAVVNTFTYSAGANIDLELFETQSAEDDTHIYAQNYTVIPDETVHKDPTLKLTTETSSYLYFEIIDELNAAVAGVADYTIGSNWTELKDTSNQSVTGPNGGKVYVYNDTVTGTDGTNGEFNIFDGLTFDGSVMTNENTASLNNTEITLYGYAVQATAAGDGGNAYSAWTTAAFTAATAG